ncbi:hypothetical protein TeGR_g4353, partial [Tetraparma gracilis]
AMRGYRIPPPPPAVPASPPAPSSPSVLPASGLRKDLAIGMASGINPAQLAVFAGSLRKHSPPEQSRKLVPTPQNGGPACAALDCRPLLTGCGRSGTHYLSDVIIKNNIPILHERIGAAGSVSWIYGAPYDPATDKLETWFSNPDGSDTRLRASADFDFYPLVHVVRHPLKAIASLLACFCGCGSMSC